jgi:hypothetical protein
VILRYLSRAWNEFFFAEQSPTPIALFRILYGLLVIATLLLLRPDWLKPRARQALKPFLGDAAERHVDRRAVLAIS